MVLIYESGSVRIMMQEEQLHIEAGSEPRIFIIIEGTNDTPYPSCQVSEITPTKSDPRNYLLAK